MKIDSHHHFWNYSDEEYGWIPDDVIRKDFGPKDLKPLIEKAGIDGVVSVQARTNSEENDFLLQQANENDFIKGVVGYADLTRADVVEQLGQLAAQPKLKGIREVLQGKEDDAFCLREDFSRGVANLRDFGLVYDILIFHRHLPHTVQFVDKHPNQVFVLDHIAKPEIRTANPDVEWAKNIKKLAKRENVFCKVSGMVTELRDRDLWDVDLLKPYFDTVLEGFTPERLMFGSDWPVCLLESGYQQWSETVETMIASLSADEKAKIRGGTAVRAYGLE